MLQSPFPMRYLDLAVICAYLVGITWFGARFRHSQKTPSATTSWAGARRRGGRSVSRSSRPRPARLRSSALRRSRFAGNLAASCKWSWGTWRRAWSSRPCSCRQYFRGEMYTAYELMQRRFGQRIRKLTAGTFSAAPGPGRGRARVCHLHRYFNHSRNRRGGVHRADRLPDPVLHLRRRDDGRDLDRRGPDVSVRRRRR